MKYKVGEDIIEVDTFEELMNYMTHYGYTEYEEIS